MATRADLESLKAMIGSVSTKDDTLLAVCLETAGAWVQDRVHSYYLPAPPVQQAILLFASRLYKRRQSPEGVAGWDEMGAVRIITRDPDIERLLEQYLFTCKVLGIA